jgi:hypothetical protein
MSTESLILLSNISAESVGSAFLYGNKSKGAGYQKGSDGVHTAVFVFDNFKGTVKIQATLELYPGDNDWFDVTGTEIGGDSTAINTAALFSLLSLFSLSTLKARIVHRNHDRKRKWCALVDGLACNTIDTLFIFTQRRDSS